MKNLIKITFFGSLILLFFSCKTTGILVSPAGSLNMVSTRNIDNGAAYVVLKTYAGVSNTELENAIAKSKKGLISKKHPILLEINKYKGRTIDEAVDKVVKSQAGGEYLMNARFYLVEISDAQDGTFRFEYVASGDVWGLKGKELEIKGFRINDLVVFTYTKELQKAMNKKNFPEGVIGKQYQGVVVGLSGAEATIKIENGSVLDIPYNLLRKLGN
jgi:hypothetical protein